MRIVIAEDSVLLREGLARVLAEGGFDVVAQAANAEELKKQDPEAHKIFEKYSGQGGIQIQGFQIQPGAVPLPVRPLQVRPLRRLADMREAQEQLDKASKDLDAAVEQLQKAIEGDRNPEELKKALERLEQVKKDVAGAKEKLGGGA